MPNDAELREKISNLSNEDLLKVVNVDFADYREEALQYAVAELRVRGISNENYKIRKENTPRIDGQVSPPKVGISNEVNEVIVTDIQMPFISMIVFMVKWALASIPAFIILLIIAMIVVAILGEIPTFFGPSLRR